MTLVTINDLTPVQALDIVYDLRAQGLVQGTDFDFAWHQSRWDEMIGEIPKRVEFEFNNPTHASWFSLKYHPS
jgi:hypothetical protein